ncbi:MAG: hypothetical protein RBR67_04965 [Desulfobacterium sp.]|jgi:hypothetical protein|nr:hypothetical protein [Desulfobacterium sp.]
MKYLFSVLFIFVVIAQPVYSGTPFPIHVGGFALGDDISDHTDKVEMKSCRSLRYMDFIQEGEVNNLPGFKSGLIAFGTCHRPNKILRIKLKYADGSRGFFNQLKQRFEQSFGRPDEYVGDSFKVVIGWKWSFQDESGERISLVLQHNTMNPEEKVGNAVKLTLTSQMERERDCFEARQPRDDSPAKTVKNQALWRVFIPY